MTLDEGCVLRNDTRGQEMGENQQNGTFPQLKHLSLRGSKGTIRSPERQPTGQKDACRLQTRLRSRCRIESSQQQKSKPPNLKMDKGPRQTSLRTRRTHGRTAHEGKFSAVSAQRCACGSHGRTPPRTRWDGKHRRHRRWWGEDTAGLEPRALLRGSRQHLS